MNAAIVGGAIGVSCFGSLAWQVWYNWSRDQLTDRATATPC